MVDILDLEVKTSEPQLKGRKKDKFGSIISSGTRDIVFFVFFKMADSCCPSWIAKFKLPPN